jgi:hypothetical protein
MQTWPEGGHSTALVRNINTSATALRNSEVATTLALFAVSSGVV